MNGNAELQSLIRKLIFQESVCSLCNYQIKYENWNIQPHYVMPGWSGNGISLIIVLSSLSPELVSISSKLFFKLILSINYAFQSSSISFSLPENSSSSSDWSAE